MTFNLDPAALSLAGRASVDEAATLREAGALVDFGPTVVDDDAASWVESDWMSALERHTGAEPPGPVAYPPLGSWPPGPGELPNDTGTPGLDPGPLAPLDEPADRSPYPTGYEGVLT